MIKLFFVFASVFNLFFLTSFADDFDDFLNQDKLKITTQEITNRNNLPTELVVKNKDKLKKTDEPPFVKKIVHSNTNWTFLTANPKGNEMCYSVVFASSRIGNMPKPKTEEELKSYLMVHYFSPFKQRISIFFNYVLQKGSRVFISIDGAQFELATYGEYAFAEDMETDIKIIKAIEKGKKLLARGEQDQYSYSVDEYDISDFREVYLQMKETCGNV